MVWGYIHWVKIHLTFDHNFAEANVDRFTKFFHCQIPEEILYTHIVKILHFTLNMFLHYLVPLPISMAYCTWELKIHLAKYEAALVAQVW